jgi:hypothetical protein
MPVSSKKTTRQWSNPFRKNAKNTKAASCVKPNENPYSFNSASTSRTPTDLSGLSPTSIASDSSSSPERYSKSGPWWDLTKISPPAPVYDEADQDANAKYGYEEASPSVPEKYGYEDATPDVNAKKGCGDATLDVNAKHGYGDATSDDKAKYGYGDADDDTSPRVSSSRTPRRSSMKQSGAPRRASIQFGGEIQVNLPGKKRPVRRRTSITFKDTVRVKNVVPVSQLTDEPEALWFQDEEYKRIRQKSRDLVNRVDNEVPGENKYCVRGLEKFMRKNKDGVMQQKYDVWDSVLNEQHLQRHHGTFDDDYMGNICKFSTVKSQREAVGRAQQDAAEIENYLKSTRKMCRRLSM